MAYVIEKPVVNDVQAPRWLGYGNGASHAFLVAEGKPLEATTEGGKVKAACGTYVVVSRLSGDVNKRCKKCAALFVVVKVKAHAGLSERTVEIVHTGAQQGSPREAESLIAAKVQAIGAGDAPVPRAKSARQDKRSSTSPTTDPQHTGQRTADTKRRVVGQRGETRLDGVAMTPGGANMRPVQPMRRNPKTKQLEVSSRGTMGGALGPDRPDRSIVGGPDKGRFTPSQRRNWRRKQQRDGLKADLAKAQAKIAELSGK